MKKSFLVASLIISFALLISFIMLYVPLTRTTGTIKQGVLAGNVNIGPICPVERINESCPVPPEAYASRMIMVYAGDGKTLVGEASIKSDGTYQIELPIGTYIVDLKKNGIDRSADIPADVEIRENQTTILDINIDTGIR